MQFNNNTKRTNESEIIPQVKAAVDIVSIVSEYVNLKRLGSTRDYIGLCPFHTEQTPSFRVHGDHRQFSKCFGCGWAGDVFAFVMARENVQFSQALRILAERAGVELRRHTPAERRAYSDRRRDAERLAQDAVHWRCGFLLAAEAQFEADHQDSGGAPDSLEWLPAQIQQLRSATPAAVVFLYAQALRLNPFEAAAQVRDGRADLEQATDCTHRIVLLLAAAPEIIRPAA